jgi:hypothetical protein
MMKQAWDETFSLETIKWQNNHLTRREVLIKQSSSNLRIMR